MRIYVASAFDNAPTVQFVQRALESAGHTITADWTREDAERYVTDLEYRGLCAHKDRCGVAAADAVVLLPAPKAYGAMVEMGMALGYGIPVYVLGEVERDCVFYHLPSGVTMIRLLPELLRTLSH